jgi:predicted nucleic acid-binding Zn ribbon protein
MTQLGLIVEDVACSEQFRESLNTNSDDDGSVTTIFLIIAAVLVGLLVLAMLAVGGYFGFKKLKSRR